MSYYNFPVYGIPILLLTHVLQQLGPTHRYMYINYMPTHILKPGHKHNF